MAVPAIRLDPAGAYAHAIDPSLQGCAICAAECPAGAIAMTPELR